jgi:hypothetical protein
MIEDMAARQLGRHSHRSHIHSCQRFAAFLKRSPDTASADDVRRFQLHLIESGLSICNRNRIMTAVRFLFRVTLRRHDLAAEVYHLKEPKMSATSRAGRAMGGALCRRRLFSPDLVGLPARLAEQVERALDGGDHGGSNPRVAGRRIELGMAEKRLNHANICPTLDQVGCKAMAQRMQRHRFLDPGCLRRLVEQTVELARRHRPARLAAREQHVVVQATLRPSPDPCPSSCRARPPRCRDISTSDVALLKSP